MKGKLVSGHKHPLSKQIRKAIGARSNDLVHVDSRPRDRDPRWPTVAPAPTTYGEWQALRLKSRDQLIALGLRPWDETGLLLLPVEWYAAIPDGYALININGKHFEFNPGVTPRDPGFGMLAYGIIQRQ